MFLRHADNLNTDKLGGTERCVAALSRWVASRKGRLTVGLLGCVPEPRALWEAVGARVVTWTGTPRGVSGLKAKVDGRVDVALLHFFPLRTPLSWNLRARLGCRAVMVDDHSGQERNLPGPMARARRFVIRGPLAAVDRVIGVSDFVTRRVAEVTGLPAHRLSTVHNGVQTRAVGQAAPRQPKLALVLARAGGSRTRLGALAADVCPRARFIGLRSDVPALISMADVVAVPSVWAEAYGLVVAEALAAGRPLVASRVGGIPELVRDGETGLLVPPHDASALAAALDVLLGDHRARESLGRSAQADARRRLTVERMTHQIGTTLTEVHHARAAA